MEDLGHANDSLTHDCNVAWDSYEAFNIQQKYSEYLNMERIQEL